VAVWRDAPQDESRGDDDLSLIRPTRGAPRRRQTETGAKVRRVSPAIYQFARSPGPVSHAAVLLVRLRLCAATAAEIIYIYIYIYTLRTPLQRVVHTHNVYDIRTTLDGWVGVCARGGGGNT